MDQFVLALPKRSKRAKKSKLLRESSGRVPFSPSWEHLVRGLIRHHKQLVSGVIHPGPGLLFLLVRLILCLIYEGLG